MIKCAWKAIPFYMKSVFDDCLKTGVFPSEWKKARVIALLKAFDKDRTVPS